MKCQNCEKEYEKIIPLLAYFANGKPIFRYYCELCEKEKFQQLKDYLMGS